MTDCKSWVGRRETRHDVADHARIVQLAALLDHRDPPWQRGVLPPMGHWLCFRPDERQSQIGSDGHPIRTDDGFLPNANLPRRMWAGSRIHYLRDIPLGSAITRASTIRSVDAKSGRSGNMLFVTVLHEIACDGGPTAIVEEQDIVYREASPAAKPFVRIAQDPGEPNSICRTVVTDPVMLFRFSALTYNAHRIHYDRDYAQGEEGYPERVVHGPLIATLLLDHLFRCSEGARLTRFQFRAASPLFVGEEAVLGLDHQAGGFQLRATGPAGVAMTAEADVS